MSKVVGDVISENFCLKKFRQKWREDQKMKILALGVNSTKFCIHNLRATRRLEMQKLTTQSVGGSKMKIIALGPNSTKFCIYNLRASRELEMQKLGAGLGCGVECSGEGGGDPGGVASWQARGPPKAGLAASY